MRHRRFQSGFTLVELAIVLVIIGLIVGGVLVGRDLIKAATIRATVTDIEKYNAAATTFRSKYGGIPGDLVGPKAAEFGFATGAARSATAPPKGQGDGNGMVEGGSATSTNILGYEAVLFWMDLAQAGLIPAKITGLTGTTAVAQVSLTNAQLGAGIIPKTRLRDSALLTTLSTYGHNYYAIAAWATDGSGAITTVTPVVSPLEARGIDEKLDDGMPLTGIVTSIIGMGTTGLSADSVGFGAANCAIGAGYNSTSDSILNSLNCALAIRTNF